MAAADSTRDRRRFGIARDSGRCFALRRCPLVHALCPRPCLGLEWHWSPGPETWRASGRRGLSFISVSSLLTVWWPLRVQSRESGSGP